MKKSGSRKKKRSAKKNTIRFALVRRSADDPLASDPSKGKMVLQPIMSTADEKAQARMLKWLPQDCLQSVEPAEEPADFAYLRQAQKLADDGGNEGLSELPHDYDYSQHLREIDPSMLYTGEDEYDVSRDPRYRPRGDGKASDTKSAEAKAADAKANAGASDDYINDPRARAKKGIVKGRGVRATRDFFAVLESDNEEEFEELEDDFMLKAMADDPDDDVDEAGDSAGEEGDEKVPPGAAAAIAALLAEEGGEDDDEDEERKWRLLDEHFESLLDAYDEEGIGEEAGGEGNDENVKDGLEFSQFERVLDTQLQSRHGALKRLREASAEDKAALRKSIVAACVRIVREELSPEENDRQIMAMRERKRPKEQWDCETILSTYSNTSNHPSLIAEPRRNRKQIKLNRKGLPLEGLPERKRDDDDEDEDEEDLPPPENLGRRRNKRESKAEKQARKAAMKQRRREARARKKNTKSLFSKEKNTHVRNLVVNASANPAGERL